MSTKVEKEKYITRNRKTVRGKTSLKIRIGHQQDLFSPSRKSGFVYDALIKAGDPENFSVR